MFLDSVILLNMRNL